jgi:hypothetical protein
MAALYRGINANVSLSEAHTEEPSERNVRSHTIQAGSTLMPNRRMTINLFVSRSQVNITGVGTPVAETERTGEGASLSYMPFDTLFLFYSYTASWAKSDGTLSQRPTRIQNSSASWSPLLSGDLWLSITASQTITSADEGESTSIEPRIRWNAVPGMSLEAGYQRNRSSNIYFRKSDTDTYFASLRWAL